MGMKTSKYYTSEVSIHWGISNKVVCAVLYFENDKQIHNIVFDDVIEKVTETFDLPKDLISLCLDNLDCYDRFYVDNKLNSYANGLIQYKSSHFIKIDEIEYFDFDKFADLHK